MARLEGDTRWSPLSSFFPPSSPCSMFNLLMYNIENYRLFNYFVKLLLFVTKLQRISHFKFEFFLPSSNFLVPPFYPPPPKKNIKVGPIIRIILVPPLSSVNLRRERSQRGSGAGGAWAPSVRNPSPLSPQMKWHFLQGSMESPGGGFFHQNRTWMCLPDLENLTISIPIFCQISHPSVYHFRKKSTQFGSNWVLFTIICPKYTQFM